MIRHKNWNTTRPVWVPGTVVPLKAALIATALNCQRSVHCITIVDLNLSVTIKLWIPRRGITCFALQKPISATDFVQRADEYTRLTLRVTRRYPDMISARFCIMRVHLQWLHTVHTYSVPRWRYKALRLPCNGHMYSVHFTGYRIVKPLCLRVVCYWKGNFDCTANDKHPLDTPSLERPSFLYVQLSHLK